MRKKPESFNSGEQQGVEPSSTDKEKVTHSRVKPLRNKLLGVIGLATTIAIGVGVKDTIARHDKLAALKANAASKIEYQRQSGATCSNRVVVLRSGVHYWSTPGSIDTSIPLLMPGNLAGTVGSGQELIIKKPILDKELGHPTWLEFTLDNSKHLSSTTFRSSQEIEKQLVWVNYDALQSSAAKQSPLPMELFNLPGTSHARLERCSISNQGQTLTANHEVAAYGVLDKAGSNDTFRSIYNLSQ